MPVTTPPDGIYAGIPDNRYHADRGSLSSSGARLILEPGGPAKWRWRPPVFKDEYDLGHVVHKLILGEGSELAVIKADSWRTKDAQERKKQARADGKVPILHKTFMEAQRIAGAAHTDELGEILFADGKAERSVYWTDAETGVRCRCRPDWLTGPYCVDVKGLALDTPIPTPNGWTTMGAIQVGDAIFDTDGQVCRVTSKSDVHFKDCYRITFDDATSVICDHDHRWETFSGPSTAQRRGVRTTTEIAATIKYGGCHHHRIPNQSPLQLDDADLPIDPYVLGAWLGDGTTADGRISTPDGQIFEQIEARGYRVGPNTDKTPGRCPTRTVYGLRTQLRHENLLGHKHIPDIYMRASVQQRLDLLRGLMDTDGSVNVKRHQCTFSSVNKALSAQVRELIISLGERAVINEVRGFGFGKPVTSYPVSWRPQRMNPFIIERKASRVDQSPSTRAAQRVIVDAEQTLTVPTQCIEVDSPTHTYLCGEQMVPTHNTTKSAAPQDFTKSVLDYGYHQQAAFYTDGLAAHGITADFLFFAVETTKPYLCSANSLPAELLDLGRQLNRHAIRMFADCLEHDRWPGYDPIIHTLTPPAWAMRRIDDTLERLEGQTA